MEKLIGSLTAGTIFILIGFFAIALANITNDFLIINDAPVEETTEVNSRVEPEQQKEIIEIDSVEKNINGTLREITAYNAGDPYQTDSTPCIGAMNTNICKKLSEGKKICAANFVPLGTVLHIQGYGDCEVEDRMNKRYPYRVDIAMPLEQKKEALEFGLKNLLVNVK